MRKLEFAIEIGKTLGDTYRLLTEAADSVDAIRGACRDNVRKAMEDPDVPIEKIVRMVQDYPAILSTATMGDAAFFRMIFWHCQNHGELTLHHDDDGLYFELGQFNVRRDEALDGLTITLT